MLLSPFALQVTNKQHFAKIFRSVQFAFELFAAIMELNKC